MSAKVFLHAAGVVEALVAHRTHVRLFARVRTSVHRQVGFQCERLVTEGARVRSLAAVRPQMVDEVRTRLERFGTQLALVRLFASVAERVCAVAAVACVHLVADTAGVWSIAGMHLKRRVFSYLLILLATSVKYLSTVVSILSSSIWSFH